MTEGWSGENNETVELASDAPALSTGRVGAFCFSGRYVWGQGGAGSGRRWLGPEGARDGMGRQMALFGNKGWSVISCQCSVDSFASLPLFIGRNWLCLEKQYSVVSSQWSAFSTARDVRGHLRRGASLWPWSARTGGAFRTSLIKRRTRSPAQQDSGEQRVMTGSANTKPRCLSTLAPGPSGRGGKGPRTQRAKA